MSRFLPVLTLVCMFFALDVSAQTPCITVNFPGGPCVPAAVQFDDCTTQPHTIVGWTIETPTGPVTGTNPSELFIYSTQGTYTVSLTVQYSNGNTATATQSFTVTTQPVINSVTASPITGCAPLNVCFSANITGGTPPYTRIWDFCDGDSSSAVAPCHVYATQGCYCYILTVKDANGCVVYDNTLATDPEAICVTAPPTACFTSTNPTSCAINHSVTFTSCSSPNQSNLTHTWSFPGGVPASFTGLNPPAILYGTTGMHNVSLTVTDPSNPSGCSHTVTQQNYVSIGGVSTSFTPPAGPLCAGEAYEFAGGSGDVFNWTVTPASGVLVGTPTQQNTNITFTNANTYSVCYNVTITNGNCNASACSTITVGAQPDASFTVTGNAPVCAPPVTINVSNTTTGAPSGTTWAWSFPGGNPTSTPDQNPGSVTYTGCGPQTISLTATAPGGCTSTFSMPNAVQINCPNVSIALSNTLPPIGQRCAPLDVQFAATSSSAGPDTQFNWNFTNGTANGPFPVLDAGATPIHSYPAAGCYNVAVQMINPPGCTATAVLSPVFNLGSLAGAPPLQVEVTPPSACASDNITLNILPPFATSPATCCPILYTVFWGDGATSQGAGPGFNHDYTDTASIDCFDITVVRRSCQCHDTLKLVDLVCINPPITKLVLNNNCVTAGPGCIIANASTSIGVTNFDWSATLATLPPGAVVTYEAGPAGSASANVPNAIMKICNLQTNVSYTITVWGHNTVYNCSMMATGSSITQFPTADFTLSPNPICSPGTMNVLNQASPAAYLLLAQWKVWEVNTPNATVFTSNNGAISVPGQVGTVSAPFNNPGCYMFQLVSTTYNGCKDTIVKGPYCAYGTKPDFNSAPSSGCAPLTVNFTDITPSGQYGAPSAWSWDFGDGNTSTQQNPSHTYTQSGTYDVTLCVTSVTNGLSCENCTTKVALVQVGTPEVTFQASATDICAGGTVNFISTITGGVPPYSYNWQFGPVNATSNLASPSYTYTENGVYTVTLSITDNLGCVGTHTITDYITVGSFEADFMVLGDTATSCPPLLVNFINTTPGYDAAAGWTSQWHFGVNPNVPPSVLQNPFHTYTIAGLFTVTLYVTAPNGCSSTVIKEDYIFVGGPTAAAVVSSNIFCAPTQVCFDANPSNSISFTWYYGDGSTAVVGPAPPNPLAGTVCHTYENPGIYYPTVLLCDGDGCCYELPIDTVYADSVSARFTASTLDLCNGGTVDLLGDTLFSFTEITSWTWTVSDVSGITTATGQNFSYNFTSTTDVTLTVTSAGGCTDDTTFSVLVTPSPVLNSISNSPTLCPGVPITFYTDVTSQSPVATYAWSFPSGTPSTSDEAEPEVVFDDDGSHTVELTVTAVNGCSSTATHTFAINFVAVADAGDDMAACEDDPVTLSGSGGVSYEWLPGGETTQSISVLPASTTTYTLNIIDANGCTATDDVVVFVGVPPVPSISGPPQVCAGEPATITASGGVGYEWNTTDTTPAITVQETATTVYTVTVTAANGCDAVTSFTLNVVALPSVTIGPDTAVCVNETVQMNITPGYSYVWSVTGASLNNVTIPNPVATIITSGPIVFTVNVTDAASGCTHTLTHEIQGNPLPNADAGPAQSICLNESATLHGSGGVSYQWQPAGGSNQNPVVSPTATQVYTVTVIDSNQCSATDDVVVTVNPLPEPVITAVDTSCADDAVILTVNTGVAFIWSTGDTTNPITDTPTEPLTYSVTITDANTCTGSTSHFLTVMPLPIVTAGPDTAVCYGFPITLFADGGVQYNWSPAALVDNPASQNPTTTVVADTVFTVLVTDQYNCNNTGFVNVVMLPLPNVVLSSVTPVSCGGDPVLLIAQGALTYEFFPTAYVVVEQQAGYATATLPDTTAVSVIGTDENGCQNSDTLVINVLYPFTATFTSDTCICMNDCGTIRAEDIPGYFYSWTPATYLSDAHIPAPQTCTTYDIDYRVVVFDGYCYSDTGFVSVCVNQLPVISAGNDTLILAGSNAYLVASGGGLGTYLWTPDSLLVCPDCAATIANPLYITTYVVSYTDLNGCRDADSVVVNVFCSDASIYVPNAFTPGDNDNLNDQFRIYGAGFDLKSLRIFNRWGEKVFETNDLTRGWDGTYKGRLYEPEVFVYYLEAVCSSGELLAKKGNVTLIR